MKHFKYSRTSHNQLLLTPAPPGTQAWLTAEQVSGAQRPSRQTQPWFSEVTMSCEPEHLTNTSQNTVSFDNLTIKRWAPMVRVVYDYYPFGLSWENPKLPNDPEGVHDHAYQDKEFQFAEFSTGHGLALYDFHARMYDPATGRWLVPDPAEQFSNPYLAMANNPVSYVDPDGKIAFVIVGAVVGAYIGGAMANDHLNPGKWNFEDPNTWIGIGVGGTIGAFGGHGLMAAKGKAAYAGMSKGSESAILGGKKLFGSTVGGTTNAISNYDGADSFGWGTLADFAAGSFGTYHGDGNMLGTFLSGGSANVVSQFFQHKQAENLEDFGGYQIAQSFVGGGLSSMNGASFGGAKGSGIFKGKTQLGKYANSFIGYGSQATMYDFAYSSQSTFTGRSFGEHLGMFAAGGFYGTLGAESFKGNWGGIRASDAPKWWRAVMGATAMTTDYYIGALIKGRAYGNFYSGQSQKNKGGILGLKYAAFSFGYLGY